MTSSAQDPSAAAFSWPQLLSALIARQDLDAGSTRWAMNTIMAGDATDTQIAGFLVALRAKGETVQELAGLVEAMLENARVLEVDPEALDIVGTGGDRLNTVNISTMAALVAAGAGATVVKHGNRAASSAAGSADVLEALGVRLDMPIPGVAAAARDVGITFCFANVFHPSMRYAAVARSQMGVATAFNFLGPLTNPAHVSASAIGVADARMAPLVAGVLAARGNRALVFRGSDGLDELTTTGPSTVWEVRNGEVREMVMDPLELGIQRAAIEDLRGKNASYNAEVVNRILAGETGPIRDAVILNAAAGLVALDINADAALTDRLRAAIATAKESIDTGSAADVLLRWVTHNAEYTRAGV
ncbi:MAG TPA: anthranilate phosphoribosyltransferase [Micrococcaceae bacterium]|nr:anthranilate phosphoribosyltransferase [Micrococcaceae bacterium]